MSDVERRPHVLRDRRPAPGRTSVEVECPFCGRRVRAFAWSLAGGGKRCPCGAIHNERDTVRKRKPARLSRIEAGRYTARDGRYTIVLDPLSGGERDGWGYRSWLVYDERGEDPDAPLWCEVSGSVHFPTLGDVRDWLKTLPLDS